MIRQIYSCLVSSDANGHVHPELAHHWHYDPHTWQWTFYLRPELTFHNGAPLDANTIVSLFAKLSSLETHRAELAHISDIKAPTLSSGIQLRAPRSGICRDDIWREIRHSISQSIELQPIS